MNYKFGTKNNWRRTAWNRIVERVSVPTREAIVLYLSGPESIDVDVAVQKGFDRRNLIAVEKDQRICRSLRMRGVLTIHGDLVEVVRCWPSAQNIHVIVADFCCGLEKELWNKMVVMPLAPQTFGTVFAVNFLRGRDHSSNAMRAELNEKFVFSSTGGQTKHRGELFHTALMAYIFGISALPNHPEWFGADDQLRPEMEQQVANHLKKFNEYVGSRMRSTFLSYKSQSGQVFDSVIYRNPFEIQFDAHQLHEQHKYVPDAKPMRRKIAAVMAHRTMRMD